MKANYFACICFHDFVLLTIEKSEEMKKIVTCINVEVHKKLFECHQSIF